MEEIPPNKTKSNVQPAVRRQTGGHTLMACAFGCILLSSFCLVVSGHQGLSPSGAGEDTDVPVPPGVPRTNANIRVHSNLVLIPVTVTDRRGRVVSGLEKEQFTLFEDDAQQKIAYFVAEDAPASVGIVFDASDSMAPKLRKAREAVNALLGSINPDSELFLVKFATKARLLVPMTRRPEEIQNAVDRLEVDGTTALLDGVRLAMAEMAQARYSRKAIIIISDGEDNSSHWTVSELKAAVREQDILIYAIAITNPAHSYVSALQQMGQALLKEIAGQTGGCMFPVNRVQQLPEITDKIGGWLRNQYVLGYVPSSSAMDGTYRKVQLKVARPQGFPRLHAVWRQGYYAPKE
jgi:Ca-activated chloride channel homolog